MSIAFSDHFLAVMRELETLIDSPNKTKSEEKPLIIQLRKELMTTFSGDINEYYLYFHLLWRLEMLVEMPKKSRSTLVIQTIFDLLHKKTVEVEFFRHAIQSKNSHLLTIAGMLYQYGYKENEETKTKNVEKDINQAKIFYEKAIQIDDSALAFLLEIYEKKGEKNKIESLLKRAFASSDPRVQTWCANLFENDFNSKEKDQCLAIALCEKAISKNYPMAVTALARIYLKINRYQATNLLERAVEMGDPVAIVRLAAIYFEEINRLGQREVNRLRVLSLSREAQKFSGLDTITVLKYLAYCLSFQDGVNNELEQSNIYINLVKEHIFNTKEKIRAYLMGPDDGTGRVTNQYLDEAIKLGSVEASVRRAAFYIGFRNSVANEEGSYQKALELLRLPLELKNPRAMLLRAKIFAAGKDELNQQANHKAALKWFDRAIALGDVEAILAKANYYWEMNSFQAAELYRMAIIRHRNCSQLNDSNYGYQAEQVLSACAKYPTYREVHDYFPKESELNVWRYHFALSSEDIKLDILVKLYQDAPEDFLNLLSQDKLIFIPEKIALLQQLKIIKTLSFPVENSFSDEQKISVFQLFRDIACEFHLFSRDDNEKIELALYYYHLIPDDFPDYAEVLREIYDLMYYRDILNKNKNYSYARLCAFFSSYQEMYAEKVFLENEQVRLSGEEFNLKYEFTLKRLRGRQEHFIQDVLWCRNKLKNNECKNALEYALSQEVFSVEFVSAHFAAFDNALKKNIQPVLTMYFHLIAGLSTVDDEAILHRHLFELDNQSEIYFAEFLSKYPDSVVGRYHFQQCRNQSLDELFQQAPTEVLKLIHEDSFMNIDDKLNFIGKIPVAILRGVLNKIPETEGKDLEDFISECFKEIYYETIADYMTNVECLSSESTSVEDKFSVYENLVITRNNLLGFLKQYNFGEAQAQYFKSHPDEVSRINLFCLHVYKVTQLHQNEFEAFHSFKERYNQLWQVSRTNSVFFAPQCIAESLAELKEQNAPLLEFLLVRDQVLSEEDKMFYASKTTRYREASFY